MTAERVERILVVCTGNTCRSPLAEALLQRALVAGGRRDVWVESAGTAGFNGLPATEAAIEVGRALGVDISDHRSSALTAERLAEADLVLCMESGHVEAVERLRTGLHAQVHLLTHYLEGPAHDQDIPDPYGGDATVYRRVGELIAEAVKAAARKLAP